MIETRTEYLTFSIGQDNYALHVSRVTETMKMAPITRVPKAPDYVRGVINLRGTVVTVMDLTRRFGYHHNQEYASIIVAAAEICGEVVPIGILADEITEVTRLELDQLPSLSELAGGIQSEFVDGVASVDGEFVVVLNVDAITGHCEVES